MGESNDDFFQRLGAAIADIEKRANDLAAAHDSAQLNWRPEPGTWSVGQCLQHLVRSNEPYFAIFDGIATGAKRITLWERVPVVPRLWGAALYHTVRPETTRKGKAPRIFQPQTIDVPPAIVDEFNAQQQRLRDAMLSLHSADLDRTIVTSPVASFITYSLRDTFRILVAHEERHIRQAERFVRLRCNDQT